MTACGPLPRPFQPASKAAPNPLIDQGVPADVSVNPVLGVSLPMARLLTASVVDAVTRYDIIAYADDHGTSRFVLDGDVVDSPVSGNQLSGHQIQWVLTTRDGITAGIESVPITGTAMEWEYGSPKVVREIGEKTAKIVARLVLGENVSVRSDPSVRKGIWIKPIIDAPGDGNFSLSRAIGFALMDAGLQVVKTPSQAEHFLNGNVRVDPADAGHQKVEVTWVLTRPDGHEVGRARQRNRVPGGTFDGRWGQTAVMIATAAVGAIRDILTRKAGRGNRVGNSNRVLIYPGVGKDGEPMIPPPSLEAK